MKEKKYDTETIRNYLLDNNSSVKKEIEIDLANNPELAYEVNVQKIILAGIETAFEKDLKERLKKEDAVNAKMFSWKPSLLAACVALFLLAIGYIFVTNTQESDLYTEYYKPYYNVVDDQRRALNLSLLTENPYKLYEQRKYKEASTLFLKILDMDPENNSASLYCGLSYLADNQPVQAIEMLSTLSPSSLYYEQASWYLALAFLKNENLLKAKELLLQISESNSAYNDRAKEVLDRLD